MILSRPVRPTHLRQQRPFPMVFPMLNRIDIGQNDRMGFLALEPIGGIDEEMTSPPKLTHDGSGDCHANTVFVQKLNTITSSQP